MRNIITPIIALAMALSMIGCDAFRSVSQSEVTAQGSPYELIVVCSQPLWEGALGDTLRSVITTPIPYLAQREPHFDLLRVTEQGYNKLVVRHRNILRCVVSPDIEETAMAVQYNLNATPQIVLTLQGNSEEAVTKYLSDNRQQFLDVLEATERKRTLSNTSKYNNIFLEKLVKERFGIEMSIPKGYTLRSEHGDNFLWLSYEYPVASQGILIYSYPAKGGAKALQPDALLEARNKYAALVPGPSDGSYMTTFVDYTPDYRSYRLDGRLWVEMHGLWEVNGDFMGGPFVSYSTVNTTTNCVVTLDMYVFSPKNPKRNYLRELEHLIYGVTFE